MNKQPEHALYRALGKKLKGLRDKAKETLAEASGAVEIDVRQLAGFELGHSRPSEDVLLLLISHFGVQDDEAVKLWELAGYGMTKVSTTRTVSDIEAAERTENDPRILFTDVVDVVVNNYGVVMNFMQGSSKGQPVAVARVGMSREHAKSLLQILQVTLNQTEQNYPAIPKNIIKPENHSSDSSKQGK